MLKLRHLLRNSGGLGVGRFGWRSASGVLEVIRDEGELDAEVEARSRIRNFSIIAHVDHGKSTLADKLMQSTKTVTDSMLHENAQLLDDMELERERGITIKMRSVRMNHKAGDKEYQLNLIDTPGHVDFSYEVSRSLAAVEGALLVIDASQGVQAQTVANVDLAIENDLEIFTVLNKIDLPHAEPERVLKEIEKVIGLDPSEALLISAKKGLGIDKVLKGIVERIPSPKESTFSPLRALIFDSYFDVYRGVVVFVRIKGGRIRKGDRIRVMTTRAEYVVEDVGIFTPKMVSVVDGLRSGEVGYVICGVRQLNDAPVGDTITLVGGNAAETPLPGYRSVKPMVFCGLFTSEGSDYDNLRSAIKKLKLNDASLEFRPDNNSALGMGFRCGFLGLLHLDIVKERLEREYNLNLISTTPSVTYRVTDRAGRSWEVSNPCEVPHDARIEEPFVRVEILTPIEYSGAILDLLRKRRASMSKMDHIGDDRMSLVFEMPLVEVVSSLHDHLKSVSRGYASFDYVMLNMRRQDLVRMDFSVASTNVEALSFIVPRKDVHKIGKRFCQQLKELIPKHNFRVAIQAKVGSKIVAAEHIEALRKDVTAKCYGGDITRKKKLLEKQRDGKKRMRAFGRVDVPDEAFKMMVKFNR